MDGLDLAILRRMGLEPFLGRPHAPGSLRPVRIARALCVSPETVKDRIARMEADGVIAGYEIWPNFRHLGLSVATYRFRVRDTARKTEALHGVRKVEGLLGISDYFGSAVGVALAYRHPRELARRVELVARLLEADGAPRPGIQHAPPPVARPLQNLDWRIIRALRGGARRPPEDVASEVGVSARTVRRRLDRMGAEGSVDLLPRVEVARVPGCIFFEAVVALAPRPGQAGPLPSLLSDALQDALCAWGAAPAQESRWTLLLLARSVAEIEALRQRVGSVPDVERVEVLIPAASERVPGWLDEAIEERVQATTAPRASGSGASGGRA